MFARALGALVGPTAVPITALAHVVVPTRRGRSLVRAPAFRRKDMRRALVSVARWVRVTAVAFYLGVA